MLKCNPIIVFKEEFDGNGMLFDPEKGNVFGLNATGCFIWKNIETSRDTDELVKKLCDACTGVPMDSVVSDVENFIHQLQDRGYISEE